MSIIKHMLKHSFIILIIWIILITVSTPALFKLEEVTHYRAERLIPSGVESERAELELVKISNRTGRAALYEIILVAGVNATDFKLLVFDLELSSRVYQYVSSYSSLYKIVREIYDDIDENIYNSTLSTYDLVDQTIIFLQAFSEHGLTLLNLTKSLHYYLVSTCRYYDEFNNTYARFLSEQLFKNLSIIPRIYMSVSTVYNGTLIEVNNAKYSLDRSSINTSYNYVYLLYDVVRVHYYLLRYTNAYQTGLNKTIVENVINYTSLSNYSVDEKIVNRTYYFVVETGLNNVNLSSFHRLVLSIIEEYVKSFKGLDYVFANSFLESYGKTYFSVMTEQNVDLPYFFNILDVDVVNGQLNLLNELIKYNNTVFNTIYSDFVENASMMTVNYYGYPVNSSYFIERFFKGEINSSIVSREVTKIIMYELTRSVEVTIIADIVYKYSGSYTFSALYDLIYAVIEHLGFKIIPDTVNYSLNVDQLFINVSKTYRLLAKLLARELWKSTLTRDIIYRSIIGIPIIMFTTQFSESVELIDSLIKESELINSIVNETYKPGNYSLLLSTLEFVISNTSFSLVNIDLNNIVLHNNITLNTTDVLIKITRKLIYLPLDIHLEDYLRIIIESIIILDKSSTYFSINDFVELIKRVIYGVKPVDAVLEYIVEKQYAGEITLDYVKYLRESIIKSDPLILYNFLREKTLSSLLGDLAKRFMNIYVSENYSAFIIIIYPIGASLDERVSNAHRVLGVVRDLLHKHGFNPVYVGIIGDSVLGYEMRTSTRRDMSRVQLVSVIAPVVVALVLITGVLATIVPFLGIATSLAVSSGLLYILASRNIITVTSWSRILLITTSFGLGMDYSSYIILRFKEKYPEIRDKSIAAFEAVEYALPAIIAASSTDIIGFAVMKLAWEFPLIASLGETIPIAILIVMLVSITLTPALLALFGDKRWFWWPHDIRKPVKRIWRGFEITPRRAYLLLLLTIVVASIGFIGFSRFKGSHDYSVFIPEDTVSYRTYVELQKYFPSGKILPVYAVFILGENYSVFDSVVQRDLESITREIESKPGVAYVYSFLKPGDREPGSYVRFDNKSFYIEIVLNTPPLSREGIDLVRELRKYLHSLDYPWISEVYVGGTPASSCEVEDMLNHVFWTRVFPTGFILMWICMALSFKSILIGIISLVTIITGYLFGVATAVYVAEVYSQPILWFLTLITLPAVLGVGLDYNSFYVNRQKYELINCRDSYRASTIAIRTVSHLVVGLGLIVTITYGSIATGSSWGLRELGIALSTSVFVTTILSSVVFVPAVLAILNTRAWWPSLREWRK